MAVLNIIAPAVVPNPTTLLTFGRIIKVLIPVTAPSARSRVHLGAAVPIPSEPNPDIRIFSVACVKSTIDLEL